MKRPLAVFLVSSALVAVCLFLLGVAIDDWPLRMVTKAWPMVALIAWSATRKPLDLVQGGLTVGLVFGLIGDMLLEAGDTTFVFGLVSFLLGHVAYIVAFSKAAGRWSPLQALPMAAYMVTAAILLVPRLGDMRIPVVAYMGVIAVMAWRAGALAEARGGWAWLAPVGAVLFLFSDTLIAMNRFVAPIDGVRPVIILTYWAAQAALTAAVCLPSPRTEPTPT